MQKQAHFLRSADGKTPTSAKVNSKYLLNEYNPQRFPKNSSHRKTDEEEKNEAGIYCRLIKHRQVVSTETLKLQNGNIQAYTPAKKPNCLVLGELNSIESLQNCTLVNTLDDSYFKSSWFPKRQLKDQLSALLTGRPIIFDKRITCHCRQSQCSKKYCQCFRNGVSCHDGCYCKNCSNSSENPFQRPPQRCRCPSNKCLTNYCECRRGSRACGPECRCIGCANPNGVADS